MVGKAQPEAIQPCAVALEKRREHQETDAEGRRKKPDIVRVPASERRLKPRPRSRKSMPVRHRAPQSPAIAHPSKSRETRGLIVDTCGSVRSTTLGAAKSAAVQSGVGA